MTTQAGLAVKLYTENKHIDHPEFVEKFLAVFPTQTRKIAALYWQNKARRAHFGLPPVKLPAEYAGKEEKTPKAPKVKAKASKASKAKTEPKKVTVKAKVNRFAGKVKTESAPKTEDELAKIKAANLKRMKEITERNKVTRSQYNGNIARGADDPFDPEDFTPEGARAEVDAMINEMDGFKAPRFLSKDQVKALV